MSSRGIAIAALILLALAGCAGPTTGSAAPASPGPEATDEGLGAVDLRYTCGTFGFPASLLTAGLGHDEQADTAPAVALREQIVSVEPGMFPLPATGWHLAGADATNAEFVTPGGDLGMLVVTLANTSGKWKVTGWGDCQARIALPAGLGPATWAFDPLQPVPDASTRAFDAMVTEQTCNSGLPADGRIVGPRVLADADTVLVLFAVRPRNGGGMQTCPSNPPTRVRVDLGEPLGTRKLLDGGTLPPGDPSKPAP